MITAKILENTRMERAQSIAQNGELERVNMNVYAVHSQTSNKTYTVTKNGEAWSCTCPDHAYRHVECKHILAVQELTEFNAPTSAATPTLELPASPVLAQTENILSNLKNCVFQGL